MTKISVKKFAALLVALLCAAALAFGVTACGEDKEKAPALETPVVTLTGKTLSWSEVEHATGYVVYENDEKIADVEGTSYTITQTVAGTYSYTVQAVTTDTSYSASAKSAAQTYIVKAEKLTLSLGQSGGAYVHFAADSGFPSATITVDASVPTDTYYTISATSEDNLTENISINAGENDVYAYLTSGNSYTTDQLFLATRTLTLTYSDAGADIYVSFTLSASSYTPSEDPGPGAKPQVDANPEIKIGDKSDEAKVDFDGNAVSGNSTYKTVALASAVTAGAYSFKVDVIWVGGTLSTDRLVTFGVTVYAGATSDGAPIGEASTESGEGECEITIPDGTTQLTIGYDGAYEAVLGLYLEGMQDVQSLGLDEAGKWTGTLPAMDDMELTRVYFGFADGVNLNADYALTVTGITGGTGIQVVVAIGEYVYNLNSENGYAAVVYASSSTFTVGVTSSEDVTGVTITLSQPTTHEYTVTVTGAPSDDNLSVNLYVYDEFADGGIGRLVATENVVSGTATFASVAEREYVAVLEGLESGYVAAPKRLSQTTGYTVAIEVKAAPSPVTITAKDTPVQIDTANLFKDYANTVTITLSGITDPATVRIYGENDTAIPDGYSLSLTIGGNPVGSVTDNKFSATLSGVAEYTWTLTIRLTGSATAGEKLYIVVS